MHIQAASSHSTLVLALAITILMGIMATLLRIVDEIVYILVRISSKVIGSWVVRLIVFFVVASALVFAKAIPVSDPGQVECRALGEELDAESGTRKDVWITFNLAIC